MRRGTASHGLGPSATALAGILGVAVSTACMVSEPASRTGGGMAGGTSGRSAATPSPADSGGPAVGGGGGSGSGEGGGGGGAGAPGSSAGAGGAVELEVVSWWAAGSERAALDALLGVHAANHPNVTVTPVDLSCPTCGSGIDTWAMLSSSDPPDAFQLSSLDQLGEAAPRLGPLDELATAEGWSEVFPVALMERVTLGGHVLAVPAQVERLNSLFFDRALFEKHGLTPPANLAELLALAEQIKSSPEIQAEHEGGVAPLALGDQYRWHSELLVFDMLLPAVGGADLYTRFWTGEADPATDPAADAALTEALRKALELECGPLAVDPGSKPPRLFEGAACDGYFNADRFEADWEPALHRLAEGRAAMVPQGGWARRRLAESGVPDDAIGEIRFPGESVFVFTAEAFAAPALGSHPEAARELLATIGSVAGQSALSAALRSPPARLDLTPPAGGSLALAHADLVEADRLGTLVPDQWSGDALPERSAKLRESLEARDMTAVYAYLVENYAALAR